MKKRMGLKLGAIILALSFFGCSSDLLEETKKEASGSDITYGCLVINDARALNINDKIKNAKVTVSSSDMTDITVDSEVAGGKGTFFIEKIPTGDNRVVTIQALDGDGKIISGWVMNNVVDIKPGSNETVVSWNTTGLGKVYAELLAKGEKIADYTDSQDSSIKNAVPSALGYYVDSAAIANDFKNGSLKSSASYKMTAAKLSYKSAGATGYTISVLDPTSVNKTIASESTGSVDNIAPGKWTVQVLDSSSAVILNKTMTFNSGASLDLGTIGNLLKNKVIIFIKGASNIWAWEAAGTGNGVELSKELGATWGESKDGATKLAAVEDGYMNDPTGWGMLDVTSKASGGKITFKLDWSEPELSGGKTTTFWYDGSMYYDTDPTANKLSDDATLASITLNGTTIAGFDAGTTTYKLSIPADVESALIKAVANDENATVVVEPSIKTNIAQGNSRLFSIVVTAEDGVTSKTYSVNVQRLKENDVSVKTISINGKAASETAGSWAYNVVGSADSFEIESVVAVPVDGKATVTYSATTGTVADGGSKTITVTVKNGTETATYNVVITYTKKTTPESEYYWTNRNNSVGTNKTIKSWSDWTEAERIAQNAAYDDPRTWMGIQEVPYDVYALYAAWDDTNLYLMVELTNAVDRAKNLFMWHDYASSDNAWWDNRDLPLGMLFNTGKGVSSKAPLVGTAPVWGVDFTDSEGFDALFYHSSKFGFSDHGGKFVGVGEPGFFKITDSGEFSYAKTHCLSFNSQTTASSAGSGGTAGVDVRYKRGCAVSTKIFIESTPTDNRGTSGQDGKALLESTNYTEHKTTELDMSYWYTIPLSTLGIDKAYIESKGIGVRQLTTNNKSLLDCSPWDVSMVDVATDPCSDDASTSHEKEDKDNITSPQARIGAM